jgi:hypothetical protein
LEEQRPVSYLSPKLVWTGSMDKGGYGVQTLEPVRAGEILAVWGGEIRDGAAFEEMPEEYRRRSLQVEEDFYLVATRFCPADYFNHSCDPNAGMSGQIVLVAMRDIDAGQEVCFDYAMTDGSPYDEFECVCGSPNCRGRVTGDDWRDPALWERYEGYFAPYIQRRIEQIRSYMFQKT